MCPYPDMSFTQVTKITEIPETLLTDFISGSTYLIQVGYTIHGLKLCLHFIIADSFLLS